MEVNKIVLNDEVLIDLTEDTATEQDVIAGKTFHLADGTIGTGTLSAGGAGNDVWFIDYDGTLAYSFSKEEFLGLSHMPQLPTHEGLVGQSWNYSLADAKEYVEKFGMLDIGPCYTTVSGATEIDVEITRTTDNPMSIAFTTFSNATIDWGDETVDTVNANVVSHTYVNQGNYTIKISGTYTFADFALFGGNTPSYDVTLGITAIRVANGISSLPAAFAYGLFGLKTITLPTTTTNFAFYAIAGCPNLISLTIPAGVTNLNASYQGQDGAGILLGIDSEYITMNIKYVSMPNTLLNIPRQMFTSAASLLSLTFPNSLTQIESNGSSSTNTLMRLLSLKRLCFGDGLTYLQASGDSYRIVGELPALEKLIIGDNLIYPTTSCSNDFEDMPTVKEIILGNSVTDIYGTGQYYSLEKIKFGASFSSINHGYDFEANDGTLIYDFSACQQVVPKSSYTLGMNANTKIIVPDNLYSAWISATNWVDIADYIYRASEV